MHTLQKKSANSTVRIVRLTFPEPWLGTRCAETRARLSDQSAWVCKAAHPYLRMREAEAQGAVAGSV